MANYHFSVTYVSRSQGKSPAAKLAYQFGEKLRDDYFGKIHNPTLRTDVCYKEILLPSSAPTEYIDPQKFVYAVDAAELRYDARTLREIIASLPNELTLAEQVELVREFATSNFVDHGMCAVVAIHEGKNNDPTRNNPHVHILLTTRPVGPEGFGPIKCREWDKRKYVRLWRENWAKVQNRAYERKGLDIRVSHESYASQSKDREPRLHLGRWDYELEQRGIGTSRGDINREIQARNMEKEEREQERIYNREQGRSR